MKRFFLGALASSLFVAGLAVTAHAQQGASLLPLPGGSYQNLWGQQPAARTARYGAAPYQQVSNPGCSCNNGGIAAGHGAGYATPGYAAPHAGYPAGAGHVTHGAAGQLKPGPVEIVSGPTPIGAGAGAGVTATPGYAAPGYASGEVYGGAVGAGVAPGPAPTGVVYGDAYGGGSGYINDSVDAWCGPAPVAEAAASCGFYGGVYGLIMNRDAEDEVWLSFNADSEDLRLLGTHDAEMQWAGGFELVAGMFLNCNTAIEVSYWGIFPSTQEANAYDQNGAPADGTGDLNTSLDLTTLNYNDGGGASSINDWFDNAARHRLRREYEIHNAEINLVRIPGCCTPGSFCGIGGGCGVTRYHFLGGFRFLRFGEKFQFSTDETDNHYTGAADELHYNIDVDNNLFGFQLGSEAEYCFSNSLSFTAGAKFGAFINRINHESFIGGANGAAVVGAGPNAGREFNINSSKTDLSFLGEIRLAMNYNINCNWRATLGYRAVAISGIAHSADQIPTNFADIEGVRAINSSSSLLLHGGFAGLEYSY